MERKKEHDPNEQTDSPPESTRPQPSDDTTQPALTEAQRTWARVIGRLLAEAWLKEQEENESN